MRGIWKGIRERMRAEHFSHWASFVDLVMDPPFFRVGCLSTYLALKKWVLPLHLLPGLKAGIEHSILGAWAFHLGHLPPVQLVPVKTAMLKFLKIHFLVLTGTLTAALYLYSWTWRSNTDGCFCTGDTCGTRIFGEDPCFYYSKLPK